MEECFHYIMTQDWNFIFLFCLKIFQFHFIIDHSLVWNFHPKGFIPLQKHTLYPYNTFNLEKVKERKIENFPSFLCSTPHYEKLRSLIPQYLGIKAQKTTHIQLLCNYPLGITTIMQLSHWKYEESINKLSCQKIN